MNFPFSHVDIDGGYPSYRIVPFTLHRCHYSSMTESIVDYVALRWEVATFEEHSYYEKSERTHST